MSANASLEWTCDCPRRAAFVRVHPDGGGLGSPYTFSCVITQGEGTAAVVHLASRAPTREEFRALEVALAAEGFTRTTWTRKNTKLARTVTYKFKRGKEKNT